jgi:transcriptional regulator GlxA family with amidase domain
MDGNRWTTAGGTSSLDLMLKVIAADHGEDLANTVADQLIYSTIRTDQDTQRLSIPTRIGVRHPKLSQVIQMMEGNIEDPISPADLAEDVGMSTRQLERLFRRYLNRSPKRYYMELRLQKARNLLDADRHERDQRGAGLRLRQPVAFLEMLPQPLQHHPLPRTRHPRDAGRGAGAAVDLSLRTAG